MEPGSVRNADGWFRLMVETDLAPGLRALGLSGSDRHYRMVTDTHRGEISIVQAVARQDTTRFTLSLGVTPTDEWTAQRRIRPYLTHSQPGWRASIGQVVLIGSGVPIGDLWWQVRAGKPFGSISKEILGLVREFALPAMHAQIRARTTGG
ncbi:hypothetical protein ACFQV2_37965 [Actinokineospora soli]|uniref:Polyketide cyclase / dehydrase and lipid transport n=1 Tax=Actinokineospora soli TaxID=1048753 RepID=A0ABW2TZI0_9PSEU